MASSAPPPDDDLGCAVRPDGTLKDASEIKWSHDLDDETPLSRPAAAPAWNPAASSAPIHPFFSHRSTQSIVPVPPTNTGSRRSGRTTRPSNRIIDPDNAMFADTTGKRKAQGLKSTRNVNPKTISEDEDDFTDDRAPARARSEQSEFTPTEVDDITKFAKMLLEIIRSDHVHYGHHAHLI
jgi:hypothetical protein